MEGMLAVQLIASVLLFVIFAVGGSVARIYTSYYSLSCIIGFAACAGTFQLQDWLRRYYFIFNKRKLAITCDFISYVVQLAVLVVLWRSGGLTLFRTFLVMTITSLAGFAMGPVTDRLRPAAAHLPEAWSVSKNLSRDLLIATQVRWLGLQGVYLIGTAIVGTAAAGGIRAAANLSGPVYLVLNSLDNFVPIRVAEDLKTKGTQRAFDFIRSAMLGATLFFGLLILPVAFFGKSILRLLYGPGMVAFYWPMLWQLLSIVVQSSAVLWFHLYRGLQDSRALLRGSAVCAAASLVSVYWFGRHWQASGIVLSSLLGQVAIVLYSILHWKHRQSELLLRFPPPLYHDENHEVNSEHGTVPNPIWSR